MTTNRECSSLPVFLTTNLHMLYKTMQTGRKRRRRRLNTSQRRRQRHAKGPDPAILVAALSALTAFYDEWRFR